MGGIKRQKALIAIWSIAFFRTESLGHLCGSMLSISGLGAPSPYAQPKASAGTLRLRKNGW